MAVRIVQSMPFSSGCAFREQFYSSQHVSDNGGIVVASTIDRGAVPTASSAKIEYNGTKSLFANTSQATILFRMRTGNITTDQYVVAKFPAALNDNCFLISQTFTVGHYRLYTNVAASIADTGTYGASFDSITSNAEFHVAVVFDGSLAAANRIKHVVNGLDASFGVIAGTMPTRLRASNVNLSVFGLPGGSIYPPDSAFIMREVRVYPKKALTVAECMDDYLKTTYLGLP